MLARRSRSPTCSRPTERRRALVRKAGRSRGCGATERCHRVKRDDRKGPEPDEEEKPMRQTYTVACLAGDGLGPELMAEASRTLRQVARMHGFAVEDVHAPFGSEALTRSGHPLPATTRTAVFDADVVLLADAADPALGGVEPDLDLRASLTQVLVERGDLVLLTPGAPDA